MRFDPREHLISEIQSFKRRHKFTDEQFQKLTGRKRAFLAQLRRGAAVRSDTYVHTLERMSAYDRLVSSTHADAHPTS